MNIKINIDPWSNNIENNDYKKLINSFFKVLYDFFDEKIDLLNGFNIYYNHIAYTVISAKYSLVSLLDKKTMNLAINIKAAIDDNETETINLRYEYDINICNKTYVEKNNVYTFIDDSIRDYLQNLFSNELNNICELINLNMSNISNCNQIKFYSNNANITYSNNYLFNYGKSFFYTKEDQIELSVEYDDENYNFNGWYIDNVFYSNEEEITWTVTKDAYIEARMTEKSSFDDEETSDGSSGN